VPTVRVMGMVVTNGGTIPSVLVPFHPVNVPAASPPAYETVAALVVPLVPPEPPFWIVPPGVTDSQLPPLAVLAVAVHVSVEYGAPVFCTVTA
jgi:hypothetical protein